MLLLFFIDILLIIAFFTLFERNLIASFHIRNGPNNVSFLGLLQPLLDALNLLTNQSYTPIFSNNFVYNLTPSLVLLLALSVWQFMPFIFVTTTNSLSLLWYLILASIIVFFSIISGWSSNNKYSLLGILRGAATTISYEATYIFCILLIGIIFSTLNINSFLYSHDPILLIIFPLILICIIAEIHRTPFDFSESESELVSGYNTEYGGNHFAFLFLGEYSILLFNSILIGLLTIGFSSILWITLITLLISTLLTNIRVTLCRYRYDLLIILNWNLLLPTTLCLILIEIPLT